MAPRLRRALGALALLCYLGLYIVAALALSDHVPPHWGWRFAYFALAGVIWGLPLRPLMRWAMARGTRGAGVGRSA